MAEYVTGSDGVQLDIASLPAEYGYDGSGNLTTITVIYRGNTYIQTFTYSGSNLVGSSNWIKQ